MRIKVLTLNIWEGGKFFYDVILFLRKENPDIILLQEVYDGQEHSYALLKKELGYPYSVYAPEFFDARVEVQADCGNAIFSRFPLDPQKPVFYKSHYRTILPGEEISELPRNILRADATIEEKTVSIFVTHGIWGEHGGDTPSRLLMGRLITDEIIKTETSILAGDFNCVENTKTIRGIEKYMHNVFKGELKTSFNMKHKTKSGYATAVVDMLFVSPDIHVIKHYSPKADVSDHLPLCAIVAV